MKETMTMGDRSGEGGTESGGKAMESAARAIRERSAALQLTPEAHVLSLLLPDADRAGDAMLAQLLEEADDLRELNQAGSRYYYSSLSMTEAYATILLHKLEGPMHLIAGTVRQNAREYRRPVPLRMFTEPPFDLPYHLVQDCVGSMDGNEDYEDIAATSTSTSVIYLYSTTTLEPDHAEMLAEWLEVGQSESA